MLESKDYFIDLLNSSKAYQFVSQYHYSHRGFKAAKINQGIYKKDTKELVGVLQWGRAAAHNIKLDRYVKEDIKLEEYLELNRFAMADSEGKNAESQSIALGIKWLEKYRPDIRLLVSYSGRIEGNYGYIYQATNWEYLGYFVSKAFWQLDDDEFHLTSVAARYKKSGSSYKNMVEYLCDNHNTVKQYDSKQFIYIRRLDRKLTPASPILPYPKPTTEYPIQTSLKIYKEEPYETRVNEENKRFYYEPNEPLFSYAALRKKRDIKIKHREPYTYVLYDILGNKEKEYVSVKEILEYHTNFSDSGIRAHIKSESPYKQYYIRKIPQEYPIENKIEVAPPICFIDEKPYFKQIDIAKDLDITRQAVSACLKRRGATMKGKKVTYLD